MTQNPAVRNSIDAPPNMNPKVPGPFNPYNEAERNHFIERCTRTIQGKWSAKQKRRAEARINKILVDQAQRARLINSLKSKLASKNWKELLEGRTDKEVQWSASPHDREHVLDQARAVCRALEICCRAHESNVPIQWIKGCCHKASEELNIATADTIARWYGGIEISAKEKIRMALSLWKDSLGA